MDMIETLTLALGASWASGINLYATILLLGGLDLFGVIELPEGMEQMTSWWVLLAALLFYSMEFIADKIPGVDSVWDMVHTFIRIPGGAMMAAGALGGAEGLGLDADTLSNIETIGALALGGTIAAGSHATKAGSRAAINTSPEPFSNIGASLAEDAMVFGGLIAALFNPLIFIGLFLLCVLLAIWILPKIWRGLKYLFGAAKDPSQTMQMARERKVVTAPPPEPPPNP